MVHTYLNLNKNLSKRIPGLFQLANLFYSENYNEFLLEFKSNANDEYYYKFVISDVKYRLDKVETNGKINTLFVRYFT